MAYQKEDFYSNEIDCYWSSNKRNLYPSVPEPYVNIYFPIDSSDPPLIKGISSQSDYLNVKSELFGVRLLLKGFYQINIASCNQITNVIQSFLEIGGKDELFLTSELSSVNDFQSRIEVFRRYYMGKKESYKLSKRQSDINDAFNFIVANYNEESPIRKCSSFLDVSPRTVHRWFIDEIGISPKKMVKIVRFHHGLDHLLSGKKRFFYDLGYFDQAHFINEFKGFTGKSPEQFTKLLSENYNT